MFENVNLIFGVHLGGRAVGNRAPAQGDVTVSVCEDFQCIPKGQHEFELSENRM